MLEFDARLMVRDMFAYVQLMRRILPLSGGRGLRFGWGVYPRIPFRRRLEPELRSERIRSLISEKGSCHRDR